MYREIKHAFIRPVLMGVKATSSASTATIDVSPDDFSSSSSGATGKVTLVPRYGRRGPVVLVTSDYTNVAANGGGYVDGTPTAVSVTVGAHSGGAGSGDDGSVNALILGYGSGDTIRCRPDGHLLKGTYDRPRLLAFKATMATATLDIGSEHASIAANATGDVTITFNDYFGSDSVVAVGSVILSTRAEIHCLANKSSVRVKTYVSGSLTDTVFYLFVYGSAAKGHVGRSRKPVVTPWVKPRLVAGIITYSGGTPSLSVTGRSEAALTDTGTGDVALVWTNKPAREPVVVVTPSTATLATVKAAATTTGVSFTHFDAGGSAADPTDLHFMALLMDDARSFKLRER